MPNHAPPSLTMISGVPQSQPRISLVLIHGLGGDVRTSWMTSADDEGTFWPKWLSGEIPGLQIWSAGYAGGMSISPSKFADIGSNLLERCSVAGIGTGPVVFIAHSCGGLIVKHLLKRAVTSGDPHDRSLADNTKGIAFLGTPHLGGWFGKFRDEALHDWFVQEFLKQHSIVMRNYYETETTDVSLPTRIMVVSKESAMGNLPGKQVALVGKDHLSLCKATSREDFLYQSLRMFVIQCMDQHAPVTEPPVIDSSEPFDVFLSHNSQDKPVVRQLADALATRGRRPWLDERELVPGRPWQDALEEIIQTTKTAAILVGPAGLGPWEDPEMRACLNEFVRRRLPVIPVLLPGAPTKPQLPLFLSAFTWVDLRGGLTNEGVGQLDWGITGKKPGPLVLPASAAGPPLQPPVTTESESGPLGTWKRRLQFLQIEEAKASNTAQKFELQEQIQEAKAKIRELEG